MTFSRKLEHNEFFCTCSARAHPSFQESSNTTIVNRGGQAQRFFFQGSSSTVIFLGELEHNYILDEQYFSGDLDHSDIFRGALTHISEKLAGKSAPA